MASRLVSACAGLSPVPGPGVGQTPSHGPVTGLAPEGTWVAGEDPALWPGRCCLRSAVDPPHPVSPISRVSAPLGLRRQALPVNAASRCGPSARRSTSPSSVDDRAGRGLGELPADPASATVKPEWKAESIGWFRRPGGPSSTKGRQAAEVVSAALVLYRQLPKVQRSSPTCPRTRCWTGRPTTSAPRLEPDGRTSKGQGAFGDPIRPPIVTGAGVAAQVKEGIADDAVRSITNLPPAERARSVQVSSRSRRAGWRPQSARTTSRPGTRGYNFQSPSSTPAGRRAPRTTSSRA